MRCRSCLVLLALTALAPPALAENPSWPPPLSVSRQDLSLPANQPDDPGFAGQWNYWSFLPPIVADNPNVPTYEKQAGIGMNIDAAWQRSIGDPKVVIAIMDSGFIWSNGEVLNNWFLNRGELPAPARTDCVGADPYDCNGDGVFNLQDYTHATGHQLPTAGAIADATLLARADHGDVNHNGYLDPQDLIAVFSDWLDTDGNGFVDDICGWDFLWNDNDAHDDVGNGGQGYSHGNGEARDSAATGNDGSGGIGVCPGCRIVPLRTGDSFLGQASNQAMATYYAAQLRNGDGEVHVIQVAQPAFTNTPYEQEAINYAYGRGVVMVASSADETSLHQMYPANAEHTLAVNAHTFDGSSWDDPANTTFLAFNNCTNWGGHIGLSSAAESCSSESTGRTAGELGLIFSYARELGLTPPLTAAEAYQVAITSAYDINKPNSGLPIPLNPPYPDGGLPAAVQGTLPDGGALDGGYTFADFHSQAGWDAHFGYGRNDARAALDLLAAGRIPPEVDITSPLWFDLFDPQRTGTITLSGVISAPRAQSFDYVVEAAAGVEPLDSAFRYLTDGEGMGRHEGRLATLDLAALMGDTSAPPGIDPRGAPNSGPHRYAATLRVRATAHYGGQIGDVRGEYRKTIFIHQDDQLMTGFPLKLANAGLFTDGGAALPSVSGEASPKLVDLDGDGRDEIVLATADGRIHAFQIGASGAVGELPGFPFQGIGPSPLARSHGAALFGDAGAPPGFALANQDVFSTPAVGDVDGDGKPEIVVGTLQGELHVVGLDGQEKPGFPVTLGEATLPKEVPNDIGVMQAAGEWVTQASATFPDGGAQSEFHRMNEVETGFFASPVLADMDGDGKLDVIQAGMDGYMHVWNFKGEELPGYPVQIRDEVGGVADGHGISIRGRLIGTPAVGDVDGDGKPEILSGSNEVYGGFTSARAYLLRNAGAPSFDRFREAYMPGWPVILSGIEVDVLPYVGRGNSDNPLMADLDRDGTPELFTHAVSTSADVFDATGKLLFATTTTNPAPANTYAGQSAQGVSLIAVNSGAVAVLDGTDGGALDYIDGTVAALDLATGAGGGKRHDYDHQVSAWQVGKAMAFNKAHPGVNASAQFVPAFPKVTSDYQFLTNYSVADLDGDGLPEIISGNGGYELTAFNINGVEPAGWPKLTGGWNMATPAIGDVDGDGTLEVVTVSRNGYLWVWKTKGPANGNVQWDSFHHDAQNTGNFATALEHRKGPDEVAQPPSTEKTGCGCTSADRGALSFLLLGLLALRRRGQARA